MIFLFSKLYHVQEYMMPDIGNENGILKNTKQENVYQITSHEKTSRVHQKLLQMRKNHKKIELLENDISGLMNDKFTDQYSYAVTNRHVRLVMAMAKLGLSFNSYKTMASNIYYDIILLYKYVLDWVYGLLW